MEQELALLAIEVERIMLRAVMISGLAGMVIGYLLGFLSAQSDHQKRK